MTTLLWNGNVSFVGGPKASNDLFVGAARTLSIDTENKDIRLHDGVTPGGVSIAMKTTGIVAWDGAVVADLGTAAELSVVSYFCKAYTAKIDATVLYTLVAGTLPSGLSVDQSGLITGILGNIAENTTYDFTIEASDGVNTARKAFTLDVTAVNSAPSWTTVPGSLGTFTSNTISIQLSASDPENKPLSYSVISGSLPPGITLSSAGFLSGNNPMDNNTYSFTVGVSDGTNVVNQSFAITTNMPIGEAIFTTPGTYSWIAPTGVNTVSAVCVGAGGSHGGGGGALRYKNNITVIPGQSYNVVVGAGMDSAVFTTSTADGESSSFSTFCVAAGGKTGIPSSGGGGLGGGISGSVGDGGGNGGTGGTSNYNVSTGNYGLYGGGGGAGGYSGNGGIGGNHVLNQGTFNGGTNGTGGGGGGGASGANGTNWWSMGSVGGGVGLYGQGANGAGAITKTGSSGMGAPQAGTGSPKDANDYGYGGGAGWLGRSGAVRIIWGAGRSFPNNAL